jgi:hypothetical protein
MSEKPEFNLTGNEITREGKIWGGVFFIFFTTAAIFLLFAFWPDKVPDIKDYKTTGKYTFELFKIRLINDTMCCDSITKRKAQHNVPSVEKTKDSLNKKDDSTKKADSAKLANSNAVQQKKPENNSAKDIQPSSKTDTVICKHQDDCGVIDCCDTIDLNTIFLILVAICGFLGNMIHVATSFTTFVGNENFKRSWTLWYVVKPFTASALAIIIYFIIRAGFLSYGSDARSVSLYGILALSALAGLFTDIATLKLKEIFETIFRPKDERDGKLTPFSIDDNVVPSLLSKGDNNISLTGKGLDSKLTIKMDYKDAIPDLKTTASSISFNYKVEDNIASGTKITLSVFDESGKEIFKKQLTVK